jgi:hypothetical protein
MITREDLAYELLEEGQAASFNNLKLKLTNNAIIVTGWSSYASLESMSKDQALPELNQVKAEFQHLMLTNQRLNALVKGRKLEFVLAYDYGKGGIGICKESQGETVWLSNIP